MATVPDRPIIINAGSVALVNWIQRRIGGFQAFRHGGTVGDQRVGYLTSNGNVERREDADGVITLRLRGAFVADRDDTPWHASILFVRAEPLGAERTELRIDCDHPAARVLRADLMDRIARRWRVDEPTADEDRPLDARAAFLKAARKAHGKLVGPRKGRPVGQEDLAKEMDYSSIDSFIRRRKALGWKMYAGLIDEITQIA